MTKPSLKDEIITLPYKELKNLEKELLRRAKKMSGLIYEYKIKEFITLMIESLRKIANETLKKF